jgi:hypothetical protein
MNKHQSSTKILIMYHCLIFCKLTYDLDRNTRLHILNMNYYKIIFEIKLNFTLKLKNSIFICTKQNCIIHNYSFTKIKFTYSLMFNKSSLQF